MPENGQGVTEAEQKAASSKKVYGDIFVDQRRCKGCGFCIAFCPPHVLAFSADFNPQGYHFPLLVDRDRCSGCNLCGLYCPDFAIYGVMRKFAPRAGHEPNRGAAGALE
jgi:2-oxoglutarate ferredoxin oxidoreductase subunit delta